MNFKYVIRKWASYSAASAAFYLIAGSFVWKPSFWLSQESIKLDFFLAITSIAVGFLGTFSWRPGLTQDDIGRIFPGVPRMKAGAISLVLFLAGVFLYAIAVKLIL